MFKAIFGSLFISPNHQDNKPKELFDCCGSISFSSSLSTPTSMRISEAVIGRSLTDQDMVSYLERQRSNQESRSVLQMTKQSSDYWRKRRNKEFFDDNNLLIFRSNLAI